MIHIRTKKLRQFLYLDLALYCCLAIFGSSCSTPTTLFQETNESSTLSVNQLSDKVTDPQLKPGDKLTISIWGHEDLSIGSVNSVYNSNEETGKWVVIDDDGLVNLPKLGRVPIKGYTIKEANYFLEQQYSKHLKDPIINVKVLNHYVSILGEVKNPGKYKIDNENVSLVELIAQANGLTDYARQDGIRLIRQEKNQSKNYKIDFSKAEQFHQQNIQIQPDDVVYVIPKKGKEVGQKAAKAAPFVGIITGLAVLVSIFLN